MQRCTFSRLSQCTAWNVSSLVLCFLSLDIFYSGACSYGKGQLHVMRDALNLSLLPYQRRPVELQLIGVGLSPVLRFVISSSNGACAQPSSPHFSRACLTYPSHCCCPAVTCDCPVAFLTVRRLEPRHRLLMPLLSCVPKSVLGQRARLISLRSRYA